MNYRLLTPGPVQIPDSVLRELSQPMLHHRTPEFEQILKEVLEKLKRVFQTQQPVMILPTTGSGAMEAAVVNVLSPGDEALVVVSGKFGERWKEICDVYGIKATALEVEWGQALDPERVLRFLEQNPKTKAVFTQVCETSTAVLHPIEELSKIVSRFPKTLLAVDAITALGVIDLPMDQWKIDIVVAGSQKAFMLPTGLSFISLSQKAWELNKTARCPRYYLDVAKERKANTAQQTYFSSPVSMIRALNVALDIMLQDGLPHYIRRFEKLSHALREAAKVLEFEIYAKAPSPSVTALLTPPGIDSEKLRGHLESKYRITVMGGQDKLKGKILRIGTLGYIREDDIRAVIEALGASLEDMGMNPKTEQALKTCEQLLGK